MSGALTALLAALLLVGADSQRVAIAHWIAADPDSSLARMRAVLLGLSLAGVSPLLFYAAALWRIARRDGARAQRRLRGVAALLLALACAITAFLWTLASSVTPATR